MEKITIWGYTEEGIEHRWKVHMKFDPVSRFLGSSDEEEDSPSRVNAPPVNSDIMMANLENLLG